MKIRFMFSVSQDGVQLHDQEAILEVDGGPGQHGTPTPNQLLEAERSFRSRFDDRGNT